MIFEDASAHSITLLLNGRSYVLSVPDDELLIDTLRDRCGITSVRESCSIGVCGSCSVEVDGRVISACLQLTCRVDGRPVVTAEGLKNLSNPAPQITEALVDEHAFQCSYCTPGVAVTLHSILSNGSGGMTTEEVCRLLDGNLCRCGTYPRIRDAVTQLLANAEVQGLEMADR